MAHRFSRRDVVATLGALTLGGRRAWGASPVWDVVVVGAGVSGLRTALALEAEGLRVKVIEARARVGGRLHTLDDVPGAPEAGGSVIGGLYARVQDTVRRLKLPLEAMRAREPIEYTAAELGARATLHLQGRYVGPAEWPDDRGNPFPAALRAQMPWTLDFAALAPGNPLRELDDWLKPESGRLDVPLSAALQRVGLSRRAIELGVGVNQDYGRAPGGVSALHLLQLLTWAAHQRQRGETYFHIAGGNQRLPEAMARTLAEPVEMSCPVFAIHDRGDSVTVETARGPIVAQRVAVTVPATALRDVRITPEPPAAQRRGIDTLTYSTVTQVLFRVEDAYWEQDGLPATMWTDTDIGQLLAYPYGPGGGTTSAAVWLSGAAAIAADRLTPAQLIQRTMATLKRIRPRAAAALQPIKVFSWQQERYTGGTWASWAPGQITGFANEIARPHGRVHFAGEHTARLERGMEGAMESADRVVLEVLDRLV